MADLSHLYWKPGNGETRTVVSKPFESEMKLEEYLFHNQDLLGDVFVMRRQIHTGARQGIPDMVGIDKDQRICVIELKNQEASEDVLPQVLGYAIWAETNPDSIKNLWLETKDKPEDAEVDWDNVEIRIIVVAPAFNSNVLRMAPKLGYAVQLLQVRRFTQGQDEFVLVDPIEELSKPKPTITKGLEAYDRAFYEGLHSTEAVAQWYGAVASLKELCASEGWNLESKFNKYYAGFKHGGRLCFAVHWDSTRLWSIFVKISRESAEQFAPAGWLQMGYDDAWHQANLRAETPLEPSIGTLLPMLAEAYARMTGQRDAVAHPG